MKSKIMRAVRKEWCRQHFMFTTSNEIFVEFIYRVSLAQLLRVIFPSSISVKTATAVNNAGSTSHVAWGLINFIIGSIGNIVSAGNESAIAEKKYMWQRSCSCASTIYYLKIQRTLKFPA